MDAPPSHEDTAPFVKVAELFAQSGVLVPQILAKDSQAGFLLLSDLGHTTYLSELSESSANGLYLDANDSLIKIQLSSQANVLPNYDEALLLREMALFPEWYLTRHLDIQLTHQQTQQLQEVFAALVKNNLAQAQVYVHRDFHSRNLMVAPENNPGILDFQDAVYGPITYDLASLYRDAYIEWEEAQQMDWLIRYWQDAKKAGLPVSEDFGDFYRDFEWMGLQRHLKVLGIFARLFHRDGKDGYLKDIPLVFKYARKVAERYNAFKPLVHIFDQVEGIQRPDGLTF
jgi:aminoglycoside/choline kinase family phosphotransferase